ncbi:efflux RND transporter permease subunit [Paraferrimonas sedimenticola]|uniref:Acriflavine resistance protein B n=1 Tax=Paraferrimonas sedimenticola TaxID=375674 RepID=A0AA37RZS2_9GAMM|nr:efflux RND transporter permease subunit [Paraferrimonas sedimenticola]GLP97994.1 acriflavine resistance protein B [Paraferrimonas sedimenticola]
MSNPIDTMVKASLQSRLPLWILVTALVMGVLALQLTPREEEPQIRVPMIDVQVLAPGLSAQQVEKQVSIPLEKLLNQIKGVEHIYSQSSAGMAMVTLRFEVGQPREQSLLDTYNKLHSNLDRIPAVVSDWQLKPMEVDDVPVVALGLWSENPQQVDAYQLGRLAQEVAIQLQAIADTSEVKLVGALKRQLRVELDPSAMAARQVSTEEVINAVRQSHARQYAGELTVANQQIRLESGDWARTKAELEALPVAVVNGAQVPLGDIATLVDGAEQAQQYQWLQFANNSSKSSDHSGQYPMVTLSVAKQPGANAVTIANQVHQLMAQLESEWLPDGVKVEVLRDYGQTANEKVNNLTGSLAFAVVTVVIFIGLFLGWRAAIVVGLAVPICYGITLGLDLAFGYTINRVTLFALILSLGLLVDDPITGVDNIERHLQLERSSSKSAEEVSDGITQAMSEIRPALLMSTLTIVLAFVPLAFITGMMGPYMAPMAFNVPVSVTVSTLVALLVTPWLAKAWLKPKPQAQQSVEVKPSLYSRVLTPLLESRKAAKLSLWLVLGLFALAVALPAMRLVPLKLLPFDNKNEVQVIIDMPPSASLQATAAKTQAVANAVAELNEVDAIAAYVGEASPMDFNGLVRRYYQRNQWYQAELRLTLADKSVREHQSHAIVLRLREHLAHFNQGDERIKVVEVPPGPPVMSTLVAEVRRDPLVSADAAEQSARNLMARLNQEAHVVEVDSSLSRYQEQMNFVVNKQKAAQSGVSTQQVNQALQLANGGLVASHWPLAHEAEPTPIMLQFGRDLRSQLSDFDQLQFKSQAGFVQQNQGEGLDASPRAMVALAELGEWQSQAVDATLFRKDLSPVIYVTAEVNGRTPAEVIADINADQGKTDTGAPVPDWQSRSFLNNGANIPWQMEPGTKVSWTGEGELRITIRVFRDMGIAFAFALAAIYLVLRWQTQSAALAGIIMSAIPLTMIGIMPGFYLMNQFGERVIAGAPEPVLFTATAMIGMIALAGIAVRNSLILVEFIGAQRKLGVPIKQALLQAGDARLRPVLLTAGTTLLGNLVITLDPVFSGLALAIIFGILASTLFSLLVVPVVYLLVFDKPQANPTQTLKDAS